MDKLKGKVEISINGIVTVYLENGSFCQLHPHGLPDFFNQELKRLSKKKVGC